MTKKELLENYKNEEEKMAIAKMLDKIDMAESKNRITYTDFLDEYTKALLVKALRNLKKDYYIFGGYDNAERSVIIFFPEKMKFIFDECKFDYNSIFSVIRITVPRGEESYNHRIFLGGLIKLGIKREKIGDILVRDNGADIIILKELEKFLYSNVTSLKRFNKSKVEIIKLQNLSVTEPEYKHIKIIVPSLRLDNIVAELSKTSRSKTNDIINNEKVFVNGECITKNTKNIHVKDKVTIRGKGRFIVEEIQDETRSGRIPIVIKCFK